MSRFYSPDWSADVEPVPYAKLGNPQSLNLYTYVDDNPTTLRDPDGHDMEATSDTTSTPLSGADPCGQNYDTCVTVRATVPQNQLPPMVMMALGHHGIPRALFRALRNINPDAYRWLEREFVTGRLTGKHYFDAAHRAYNEATRDVLKLDTPEGQEELARDVFKAGQKILNSEDPAIRGYLDSLKTADGLTGRQALQRALQGDGEAVGDFISGAIGKIVEGAAELE
jgi:hypothetical protein